MDTKRSLLRGETKAGAAGLHHQLNLLCLRRINSMPHTYDELKHKTVAQLREIAAGVEHEAVKGASQLNKEHLLVALCSALGIERHVHHQVKGVNKAEVKAKIRDLKKQRDGALTAHDHKQLKVVRREIHHLKRMIRRATV
jgi:hypothetical protein